jgi:hypothetical protein
METTKTTMWSKAVQVQKVLLVPMQGEEEEEEDGMDKERTREEEGEVPRTGEEMQGVRVNVGRKEVMHH